MKLNDQHILDLYKFTRQHYVEHYDVQTELVDHLANDIENIWNTNPSLSFEKARDISFKKFGVFGFMDIVEQKRKELGKKYSITLWKYAKEWFRLPKVLQTISLFLFFFYIIKLSIGAYIFAGILIVLTPIYIYQIIKLKKRFKKRTSENGKKWMLEEMIFNTACFGGFIILSNLPQISNYIEKNPSNTGAIIIACLLTLTIIYSYITMQVIPQKTEELLTEHYPEYSLL